MAPVLADRFEFYKLWDEKLEPHNHDLILNGAPDDYRRLAFFDCCGHDLPQMKAWLAQREFEKEEEQREIETHNQTPSAPCSYPPCYRPGGTDL